MQELKGEGLNQVDCTRDIARVGSVNRNRWEEKKRRDARGSRVE